MRNAEKFNVSDTRKLLEHYLLHEDLENAEKAINKILTYFPDEPDLLYHLGNIYRKTNRFSKAIQKLNKSLALDRQHGFALNCLGVCYLEVGDKKLAKQKFVECYHVAKSSSADLLKDCCFNLAHLAANDNEYSNIKKYILQIPSLTSNYEELRKSFNLCAFYLDESDVDVYISLVTNEDFKFKLIYNFIFSTNEKDKLLKVMSCMNKIPNKVDSYYYWASCAYLSELDFIDGDLKDFALKMLDYNKASHKAYYYLSVSMIREGLYNEAMNMADIGLTLSNDDKDLCHAKAFSAHKLGYTVMSSIYYRKSEYLKCNNMMLYAHIADLYHDNMRRDLEINELDRVIAPIITKFVQAGQADMILQFHSPILAKYIISGGYAFEFEKNYYVSAILSNLLNNPDVNNISPSSMSGFGILSLQMVLSDVNLYNKILRNSVKYTVPILSRNRHSVSKRNIIKVGYISPDLRRHSVGIIMSSIFKGHSDNIELFLYSLSPEKDDITAEIASSTNNFYDIFGLPDSEASELIESHGIDVLVDLAGYTAFSKPKILAYNPAPVQIHMMGQTSSLCSDNINYFLGSKNFAPDDKFEEFFDENVVLMPNMHMAMDKFYESKEYPSKTELNLPEDKFVLYSFATEYRMDKEYFDLVSRILKSSEDSIFWLKCTNQKYHNKILSYFDRVGVCKDRIYFDNNSDLTSNWQHKNADLMLDSLRISGCTSIFLALQVGLPVVVYEGNAPWERHSSSILRDSGLDDLVAVNLDDYAEKVIKLADDKEYYSIIRDKVIKATNETNMFNAKSFALELEDAYYKVWDHFISGAKDKVIRI